MKTFQLLMLLVGLITVLASTRAWAQDEDAEPSEPVAEAPKDDGDAEAEAPQEAEPQPVDLRVQFADGRVSRYSLWHRWTNEVSYKARGQSRKTSMTLIADAELNWEVKRVHSDGGADCVIDIDWITVELSGEGEKQKLDSRKGSGKPEQLHKMLKTLASTPLKVTLEPDGTIKKFDVEPALKKLGEDGEGAAHFLDMLISARDLAAMENAPAEALPGVEWDVEYESNIEVGTFEHDVNYEVTGIEYIAEIPVANIVATSKMKFKPKKQDLPPEVKSTIKVNAPQRQSQIMFDARRGEIVGRNTVESYEIDATVKSEFYNMSSTMKRTLQTQVLRLEEK